MSNPQRGEITALLGGKQHTFCLTLGALAELETNLADEDIIEFTERLTQGHIKARDLVHLLGAALRGAGESITDAEVASIMPEGGFGQAVELAARLIATAFGGTSTEEPSTEGDLTEAASTEVKKKVASLGNV